MYQGPLQGANDAISDNCHTGPTGRTQVSWRPATLLGQAAACDMALLTVAATDIMQVRSCIDQGPQEMVYSNYKYY